MFEITAKSKAFVSVGFLAVSLQGLAQPVKLTHHPTEGIGPSR